MDGNLELAKRILEIDPRNAAALNDLAFSYHRGGDLGKAIAALESAAGEENTFPETYYNLAVMPRGVCRFAQRLS